MTTRWQPSAQYAEGIVDTSIERAWELMIDYESYNPTFDGATVTHEPLPAEHELRRIGSAILTPHIAFASEATLREYALSPARAIIDWAAGRPTMETVTRS